MRRWGTAVQGAYVDRIDTIRTAPSWEALRAIRSLRVHALLGARRGQWSMTLHGRWRLIVEPVGETIVIIEEVSHHYGD